MNKVKMQKIYVLLLCFFPLISCSQFKKTDTKQNKEITLLPEQGFTSLKFEAEGKSGIAIINNQYIDYQEKSKFPLSLFIMIHATENNKSGEKEDTAFNTLQTEIISELAKSLGNYCYVGTTTMPSYHDIILYIKLEDRKKAIDILENLKNTNSSIRDFSFEEDAEWDAVDSFYKNIALKN